MNINHSRRRRERASISPLSIAFAVGAAVGAAVALFTTPHSGGEMRRRIASGVKTAQEELSEVVEETRGAVGALTKDARQTLRYTALRLTDVVSATKDAFQAEAGVPERIPADE
ncbi:MAG: YtxH domain-containing protein [Nitrospirales bacterium]